MKAEPPLSPSRYLLSRARAMLGDGIDDDEGDAREREIRDEFRGGLERRAPPNRAPSVAARASSVACNSR